MKQQSYMYSTKEEALNWYLHVAEFSGFRKSIVTGYKTYSKATLLDFFKKEGHARHSEAIAHIGSYESCSKGVFVQKQVDSSDTYFFTWSEIVTKLFQRYDNHNKSLPCSYDPSWISHTMDDSARVNLATHIIQEFFFLKYFNQLDRNLNEINSVSKDFILKELRREIVYENRSSGEILNVSTGQSRLISWYSNHPLSTEEEYIFRIYDPNVSQVVGAFSLSVEGVFTFYQAKAGIEINQKGLLFKEMERYSLDIEKILELVFKNIYEFYNTLTADDLWLRTKYAEQILVIKDNALASKKSFVDMLASVEIKEQPDNPGTAPVLSIDTVSQKAAKQAKRKTNNTEVAKNSKKTHPSKFIFKEIEFPRSGIIQLSLL